VLSINEKKLPSDSLTTQKEDTLKNCGNYFARVPSDLLGGVAAVSDWETYKIDGDLIIPTPRAQEVSLCIRSVGFYRFFRKIAKEVFGTGITPKVLANLRLEEWCAQFFLRAIRKPRKVVSDLAARSSAVADEPLSRL
jgi:hypothetical protein